MRIQTARLPGDLPEPAGAAPSLRRLAAVVAGNALEFYDFLTYAYFAVYIGHAFFPSRDPAASLLLTLGTFGAGFVTRPIGAVVIGRLGDRVGRKPAMFLSFALMGVAILGLALTPTFAAIGVAAPVLVLTWRLIQGFALGGEVGPTTAYLVEAAAPHRRGLYGSLQYASQNAATLSAGLVGIVLATALSPAQLQAWGWRAAMLLGVAIVPFGLWLRRGLPETLHAAEDAALAPDTAAATVRPPGGGLSPYARVIACGLALLTAGTIATYVATYLTTWSLTTLRMTATAAFGVAVVKGGVSMLLLPLGGWLSDRYGRRPVMLIAGAASLVSLPPAFLLMVRYPTPAVVYPAVAVVSALVALAGAPVVVTLTEALPRRVRSGVVAVVYAVAITVFGGSTQPLLAWLAGATHDPLAPAWVWSVATVLGLIAAACVAETAPALRSRAAVL